MAMIDTDDEIPGSPLDVLVVDDEPDVRDIILEYLERKGFHVDVAHDGLAALEVLKQKRYDVIVTDIKMPRMTGDQFIEEARKIPDMKSKMIVMTGGVDWQDERRATELADFQIRKPFEFKEFYLLIKKAAQGD